MKAGKYPNKDRRLPDCLLLLEREKTLLPPTADEEETLPSRTQKDELLAAGDASKTEVKPSLFADSQFH